MSTESLPRIDQAPPDAPPPSERQTLWSATASLLEAQSRCRPLLGGTRRLQAPLSFAQERLWFLHRTNPRAVAYNIPFAWRILGPLNIPALQTALNRIVQRHAILQTSFQEVDGVPFQAVHSDAKLVLTEELIAIEDYIAQPFDVAAPPLIRANVLVCGPNEFYLTIVIHHLIFDGWSKTLFLRELNAEYAAVLKGIPSTIEPPSVQYIDYAAWHRDWLESGVLNEQVAYWRSHLAPAMKGSTLHGLELPSDRARISGGDHMGAALFFSLPAHLYRGVERLRKQQMTTRYVVLLAAFKALLHRYTGEEDIVIGSVTANRNHNKIRNIIGCFVNPLALRTHVGTSMHFRDLLVAVEETARGAFANQEAPFERVVSELKPARALNRSPLFQIMFALQNTASADLQLAGVRARPLPVHHGCAKFDLSVELTEQSGRITACIEYSTALFDRASVHRMALNFAVLLEGAVENPDCEIGRLPLLSLSEERQLVTKFNDTATAYPRDCPVPELFSQVARSTPSAVAISDGAIQWSYYELNKRASAIAAALHQNGVRRGTLVALTAARNPETIAAMLGILKAGGAYVPIDPAAPPQRVEFLLNDSGARVVLAHTKLAETLPNFDGAVLRMEALTEGIDPSFDDVSCAPDDIAYVLYTSGSTGSPKGVRVPHRAITRLVRNTNYIHLNASDVMAQAASLAFDAATFEVWGALLNGARLEILPQEVVLAPAQLAQAIQRRGITTLFLTTSLFNLVASEEPSALKPLRTLLFGGEVADPAAVRAVLKHGRPKHLLNVYGPTETTTFATWHRIETLAASATTVPIGKPISNTEVYLLDPAGCPVPIGVRGEIYIGGDGAALGYLRRPELTTERFVSRRIGRETHRLYRTGDYALRKADGAIEFLGRSDDQVKLRGFRIELPEVELALRQHPEVRECCAAVRNSASAGRQLVAYVTSTTGMVSARQLRDWLKPRLPDYMVPAAFVFLPKLPLNSNGKVDRAALPEPDIAPTAEQVATPWIALHIQLIHIWQDLLKLDSIGLKDDFFHLGGHSLLAVRLMDRIEQDLGRRLPISTLFSHSTVETLAAAILDTNKTSSPMVEIQAGAGGTPVYFLHGDLFGAGLYCRQFARGLGTGRPFFALAPHGATELKVLHSIETMAAEHLRVIRKHRPTGPYILGGFCVSALIALEMAQLLRQSGEVVEMVLLLDPPAPRSLWWLRRCIEAESVTGKVAKEALVAEFSRGFHRVYRARELWSQTAVQKLDWLKSSVRRKEAPSEPQEVTSDSTASAYLWATAGYRPVQYEGKAMAICCDSVLGSGASRNQQWKKYLRHLDARTLDCKHLELVTTRSADVTTLLREHLSTIGPQNAVSVSQCDSDVHRPGTSAISRQ